MRKNYRVFLCKQCNKKRRIYWGRSYFRDKNNKDLYQVLYCSKGHHWEYEVATTEKIVRIMEDVMIKKVKNLFERDDVFYRAIKRR